MTTQQADRKTKTTRTGEAQSVNFGGTYERLRAILKPFDRRLDVRRDGVAGYESWCHGKLDGREMFFARVTERKRYVSFHLFPVYTNTELLEGMSPELRKRMQGKSCFNFRRLEKPLERELRKLTKAGFDCYRKRGLIAGPAT